MTVTAPPRPPRPPRQPDPVERPDPEALIEEARQRARRRRRAYAAAAAALALLGVSLAVVFGRPESSQSAATGPPAPPTAADDDDAATLVARYANNGFGFVYVYADGRVISSGPDPAVNSSKSPIVRRLNAAGLDAVRSGAVKPSAFVWQVNPSLAGLWADAEPRTWEPPKYAVCPNGPRVIEHLPAPAQALLRGKERTYTSSVVTFRGSRELTAAPTECFEVSRAEATLLRLTLLAAGLPIPPGDYPGIWRNYEPPTDPDAYIPWSGYPPAAMHVFVALPHGELFAR